MVIEQQISMFEDNPKYEAFVEKFKPKLTTDDCYTPHAIYDAVRDWACCEYGIDPDKIVRPFYPGGDYENFAYPHDCVVLDNPPFSILARIYSFYLDRGISFFLFAPSLTVLSGKNVAMRTCHIICDADITYENGALVRTAFVTNLGGDIIARTAPALRDAINAANNMLKQTAPLPKYEYPDNVITSAMLQKYAHYGIDFAVRRADCLYISALDAQRTRGKAIFGAGLLLSDKIAAEKAAAEKAVAEKTNAIIWELSERERKLIAALGDEKEG